MSSLTPRIASTLRRLASLRVPAWVVGEDWFDRAWYLARYPEVAAAGVDPLVHYWRHGRFEARSVSAAHDLEAHEALYALARDGHALAHLRRTSLGRTRPGDDAPGPEVASGLFDGEWYVQRNPLAANEVHPIVHYYRSGRHGGEVLHPGPLFDALDYVAHRPVPAGVPPLTDYLRRGGVHAGGVHRGEPAAVVAVPSDRGAVLAPRISGELDLVSPTSRMCVHVHAFYLDLLEGLLQSLLPLRGRATILVSVCDPDEVAQADRVITKVLGRRTKRVVRVVPNRGRNFGPLLCSFPDEVQRHDLLLHLHTKKSLYSGGERSDWRGHLLNSLTGPAIAAALDVFAQHPQVGVVQPAQFREMPPWAAHWLGNVPHGRTLFERCGLDPSEVDGFVDYPVGGMFWARVAALRPLLQAGLTIDEFEPEAGQTDCTLAHAVERVVTAVAASTGHHFVEFGYDEAQWRMGWSRRNTDTFGIHDRDLLRRQLQMVDLVSVDVFDTMLLRPTLAPTSLQYFAARSLTDDPEEAQQMVEQRIAAEHAARVRHSHLGDVSLAEVYAELSPAMKAMMTAEVAIEPRVALPRQWLLDDLRAARRDGKRMVVMTDTTLDRATIASLLRQVGAHDLFDELYVSNERRARKDTGGIWPLVAQAEGVPPERWLHIGDNERSDAQRALENRVGWAYIPSPRAVAQFYADGGRLERGGWATSSALGLSSTVLYDGCPSGEVDDVFGYGVLGPLLLSFVGRLVRRRAEAPAERMLLMARDTHLVHRALETVGVEVDYFLTSRRAALAVSQAAGFDAALLLESGAFVGDFRDLVEARTGYRPEGQQFARRVSHPDGRAEVEQLLAGVADALVEHGAAELVGLQRYLRWLGIDGTTPLCLVDLGYSATTQRALARVLPNAISGVYCVTTPVGSTVASEGWFGEGVPFWSGNWFLDHSLLLEALLSEVAGPVLGYLPDEPGEMVRRGDAPSVDVERIARVQTAALRFCTDLVAMCGTAILADPISPKEVLNWVRRIPARFLPSPETLFADLRIENGFVGKPDDIAARVPH